MKRFLWVLLFFLVAAAVHAHAGSTNTTAGPYTIELATLPEQPEPGAVDFIINIETSDGPAANMPVWVRLSDRKKVYLAGTFMTDAQGAIPVSYYFDGPGVYDLTTEVGGARGTMQVHVHGQYMLLFGFLAAVFISIALLLDRQKNVY